MLENNHIFTEMFSLIDEQLRLLLEKPTATEVEEYAERQKRIAELFERLGYYKVEK